MPSPLTEILKHASPGGDPGLIDRVYPLAYSELRRIAGALLRASKPGLTLQPTALVNEAYLKLLGSDSASFESRAHFFGVAARAMRQVLVDHARRRLTGKRGGGAEVLELNENIVASGDGRPASVLEIDTALGELAQLDERKARVIEMRFFAGMTGEEISAALGISTATVTRDLRMGQAWLASRLSPGT